MALSFVQKPSDLIEARSLIGEAASLMAKIETPMALDRIDDIIGLSDGVMVARGDLDVEIPPEEVPGRQKELVRAFGVPENPSSSQRKCWIPWWLGRFRRGRKPQMSLPPSMMEPMQ